MTVVAVAGLFFGWPQGLQAQGSDRTFHAGHACRTMQLLQNLRDMPGGPQLRDRPSMVGEQVLSTADDRKDRRLMQQAQEQADSLGRGIQVYRQGDPMGWPLYVVFPGDVDRGQGVESYYEQGIAVPPRP